LGISTQKKRAVVITESRGLLSGKQVDYWVEGRILQCEVFVDSIATLQLLTTVRKLVVGDAMILQVQAFDHEGCVF
jgi:hypothetical protein